jgi:regulator of sigma E protease
MLAIISFLIVLSVLILIHEAGHYLASRMFGVKADEFGYGLPPRMIGFVKDHGKWKRVKASDRTEYKHTIWSINWLPIGGFVKIKGEQGEHEHDADSFHVKPIWQRFIIIAAGVIMNWILAALLFSIGLMIGMPAVLDGIPKGAIVNQYEVTIVDVLPGSPAEKAGVQSMDIVKKINELAPTSTDALRRAIDSLGTDEGTLTVERNHTEKIITVKPEYLKDIGKTGLGVALADTGIVKYPVHLALVNGVVLTGEYTKSIFMTFVHLFGDLFHGGGETVKQVSGPVGIAVLAGKVAQQGIMQVIQFAAILSINLAVLNFLPIPALDGGRAVFLILEAIRRKPVKRHVEALIHNIAFLILIILIILISARDVSRFFIK